MSTTKNSVTEVLKHYGLDLETLQIQTLGNHGGYSGAAIWKLFDPVTDLSLCLRCWPCQEGQSQRVELIHAVFAQVSQHGFESDLLPVPLRTRHHATHVNYRRRVYELAKWLPGKADYWDSPSSEKIRSVATTLARFHRACRCIPVNESGPVRSLGGIAKRLSLIDELNGRTLAQIGHQLAAVRADDAICEIAQPTIWYFEKLNRGIRAQLQALQGSDFASQYCIKDIWHDHVLFEADSVSGIVDFGALGVDNIAADISRLFGSLFQNERADWQLGMDAYQSVHELSSAEKELIEVYDRSTTMLAGMNWLKWIFVEKRKFECYLPIRKRMELLVNRMSDWI